MVPIPRLWYIRAHTQGPLREAKEKGSIIALAALDESISTYVEGFNSDPRDYYPA
jgi:hypothetical protein